jgi:hypothetical protein
MPEIDDPDTARTRGLDPETRRVAAAGVAGAALGWWPAFTLGVYGVIFFEQHMALWAIATGAFIAAGLAGGRRIWRRPAIYTLLLPSLWLLLAWLLPVTGSTTLQDVLFWLGLVTTLVGMPALAAFMVRLLIPGAEVLHGREALIAVAAVITVMVTAYVVGTQHPHMLSCDDFSISGNFAPDNCNPGIATTESGTP